MLTGNLFIYISNSDSHGNDILGYSRLMLYNVGFQSVWRGTYHKNDYGCSEVLAHSVLILSTQAANHASEAVL